MDQIAQVVAQTLDVKSVGIYELLPGDRLLLRAGTGWPPGSVGHLTFAAGPGTESDFLLRSTDPIIVDDAATESRFPIPPILRELGFVSAIEVKITTRPGPFGFLGAFTERRHAFGPDDAHFFQAVANVLALAIERKRLEERSANYAALIASSEDAIYSTDLKGIVTSWNPAAEHIYGYSAAEMIGQPVTCIIPQEHQHLLSERLERLRRGERIPRYETVKIRKDGERVDVVVTIFPIKDAEGRELGAAVITRDVTSIKRAERERHEILAAGELTRVEAERLAIERTLVLGQISDGVIAMDCAGNVTFANEAARHLLGVTRVRRREEAAAYPEDAYQWLTLDGAVIPTEQLSLERAILTGETIVNREMRVRRPNGTEIIIQGSAVPIVTANGTRVGGVLTFRDVTAAREFEQRKNEFIAAISHELRTPLTVIKGQVQYLARQLEGAEPVNGESAVARLEKVDQTATTMTSLINELIDAARGGPIPDGSLSWDPSMHPLRVSPELQAIGQIANVLVQDLDLARIGTIIATQGLRLTRAPVVGLWLADPERQELRLIARASHTQFSPEAAAELGLIPYSAPIIVAMVVRTGQPMEIRDVEGTGPELEQTRRLMLLDGFHAVFAQPLSARGQTVGVITTLYYAPHVFLPEERELVRALGDCWAVAIDNARLHAAAQAGKDPGKPNLPPATP
jgi:PAS domain S-box-containing protein